MMNLHNWPNCLVLLGLAITAGCGEPPAPPIPPQHAVAITNVTVIDAVSGVRDSQTVVLDGDNIVSVMPSSDMPVNARQVIDGSGQFLIPGLWDMHVHITYESALTKPMPDLFLDYGITSVRDTGGMLPKLLPEIATMAIWRYTGATGLFQRAVVRW